MNVETLREYCLSKKAVTESTPFDDVTLVFKVMGKMFALVPLDELKLSVALKCDPDKAIELREQYPSVKPGYHFNKKHWNTVTIDGSVSSGLIMEWIDHSYELVVKGLTKKQQALLRDQEG
ncbi:MAG: MmcQ/YjbR family DNA-binding protein [Bacteroidota bacterium]